MRTKVLLVPGWRDSGPDHWQTRWQKRFPAFRRLQLAAADWETPNREVWVEALTARIAELGAPVVLVAHSLGCIAVQHLAPLALAPVVGALFVAPADPETREPLASFAPVPMRRLPFVSKVIASADDPFCPADRSSAYAEAWGSRMTLLDNAGHINAESGHGDWPEGLKHLETLRREIDWKTQPREVVRAPRATRSTT
ncbi:RBBP9/YdeN family alpha/beta hydrolase [Derxia lacustris]|uniref:RBBP9/YdeN family alpha/beta hydrolase n=1 Tax=Derxia lacustris TaxID=764842 RepID=UPI000A16F869|nr:alpha/beta hydrolase [Derxia lacustris]